MRTKPDRCGAILDLIDRCLADYESERHPPSLHDDVAAPGGAVLVAARHDARLVDA